MNIIANNVASKLFVAFVAAAMLFTLSTPAQAQTAEELQAQINALMAQIAGLQGSTLGSSSCASVPAPLTLGAQGADVTALQNFLIQSGQSIPAGATGYFGGQTQAALASWQAAHNVAPAAGYYGPITKAAMDAMCVATPTTPTPDDSSDDTSDDSDDDFSGELEGEATLDNMEIDSASDDEIEEGQEDAEVAEATIEFADGDAEITRVDVAFTTAISGADVWDVLDEVSLWVDGEEIARTSASDEDDYQDEDTGTLRFSGLDLIAMEDEEVVITIAATIQGTVDSGDQGTYTAGLTSLRFVDGDDVTDTISSGEDFDNTVNFTIEDAGAEDELIVKTSSSDPDGTTLQLEDDSKSDWYTLFAFDLDTDDSVNDIEINEVPVTMNVSSSTYALLVDDVELVIDGVTIDDVTASATVSGAVLTFDVDGDVVIEAGDRVTAELMVRFKSLALGNEGVSASGTITSAQADLIDAEGADVLAASQLSGAAVGDDHTLRTAGINVTAGDMDETVTPNDSATDDYGTYSIEVEVTAFEQDVYISTAPGTSISYTLEDGASSSSVAGSRSVTLTSTGDEVSNTFEITEGSTETLTLTVTYTPGVANTASRLQLNSITFGSTSGTPTGQTWTASPEEDYRTGVITMVN